MVNLIPVLFVHPKSNYNKFPFLIVMTKKEIL